MLVYAKIRLNSLETLASQTLNDMGTSHEKFIKIGKDKYGKMKEHIRTMKSSD